MRTVVCAVVCLFAGVSEAGAQSAEPRCRVLCAPEFNVEPTVTITNLFGGPGVEIEGEPPIRERRATEFEMILALDVDTGLPWLGFTVEAIFLPFDRESTPDLEFEAKFTWLPADRTRGWVSSHFDIVDKFSAAKRPGDRRAYTHKLNLELDTSLAVFTWLPDGRWLRGVELEGSLDYVATGLPRAGDHIDGVRFLDNASPWSFSLVFVLPVAPF